MNLHVDYIDNFEAKALDAIRDLSADAEKGSKPMEIEVQPEKDIMLLCVFSNH